MCIKLNDLNKEVFERAVANDVAHNIRLYKSRRRKDLWLYIACMMLGLLLISLAELIVLNNS